MRLKNSHTHIGTKVLQATLIASLAVGLMAGSVFAAKGGGGGKGKPGGSGSTSGSLALVMVTDNNGNGAPNWGDTITFTVTSTSEYPTVDVLCYQGSTLVYSASAGFYASYPWPGARNMPLSSPSWTSGAADCKASLNGSLKLSFTAGA